MSAPSLMSAFSKPVTFDEQLDSIIQATPNTAVGRIKIIEANGDGYSPDQVLLIFETALTREVRTNPQRRSVIQALKQAIKRATPATKSPLVAKAEALTTAKPVSVTVVPASAVVLASAVKSMEKLREALGKQEDAFWAATLGARLQIGLQCLKAYHVFVINQGKGGRPKKTVTRDGLPEGGFEGWLVSDASWLKKPTAYKYMTAVRGLGCDHDSTEKQVAAALKFLLRKGPVTLKSLCDAALEAVGPPPAPPEKLQQSEFDFLRDGLSAFRTQADALLALKADLHKHPDMERVASARIYSLLVEITGSHWKPSDEPDDLANVNPDAIEL
jgi:hypothetical protein